MVFKLDTANVRWTMCHDFSRKIMILVTRRSLKTLSAMCRENAVESTECFVIKKSLKNNDINYLRGKKKTKPSDSM